MTVNSNLIPPDAATSTRQKDREEFEISPGQSPARRKRSSAGGDRAEKKKQIRAVQSEPLRKMKTTETDEGLAPVKPGKWRRDRANRGNSGDLFLVRPETA